MVRGKNKESKRHLIASVLLGSFVVAQNAFSQTNTSSISLSEEASQSVPKKLSLSLSLEGASNFYGEASPDREISTSITFSPGYKINSDYNLAAEASFSRDEVKAGESSVSNTSVSLSRKLGNPLRDISAKASLGGVIPTNEIDRKEKSYQGAVSLGAQLVGQFKLLTASYSFRAGRNIHEFTQAADGSSNIQYSLTNMITLDLEIFKNTSLGASALARTGWTYQGSSRQLYGNEFSLSHSPIKDMNIAMGVRNEGAPFKADGVSNNIKVFDQNTTLFFASLSFTQ